MRSMLASLLVFIAFPVVAQQPQGMICIDKPNLAALAKKNKWTPAFVGHKEGKGDIMVMISPEGEWTLMASSLDQTQMCVIISGETSRIAIATK